MYFCQMIQRIQSLYLLAISIICLIFILLNIPLGEISGDQGAIMQFGTQARTVTLGASLSKTPEINLILLFGSLCLTSLASIFLYKNLKLQKKAVRLIALISLLALALPLSSMYFTKGQAFNIFPTIALLAIPVILAILALRGISHDANLLAKMDRIR
jgi:hypothetical protein